MEKKKQAPICKFFDSINSTRVELILAVLARAV